MTGETSTSSAPNLTSAHDEISKYQVLGDLVPGLVLVCNCNTFQVEYANLAFYDVVRKRYASLLEFLAPLELKKAKYAIRYCIENKREETALIRLNPDSDKVYNTRFKPVDEQSILMVADAHAFHSMNFDQKEILDLLGDINENSVYGLWYVDLVDNCISWSDGMYAMLDLQKSEVDSIPGNVEEMDKFYFKFIDEKDHELILEKRKMFFEQKVDVDMDYHITTATGKRKKIHTSVKVLDKNERGVSKCVGINKDVSAPSRLSELLLAQASELALREKMLQFGTWKYDVDTGQIEWSDGTYWLFGYDPYSERRSISLSLDFIYSHIEDLDQENLKVLLGNTAEEGGKDSYERNILIRTKSGEKRMIEFQVKIFRNSNGMTDKIYGTARDITEKDHLMQELISYKQMVQEKEEFLGHGSFEYDLLTGANYLSEGLLNIYNISPQAAQGLTLRQLFERSFLPEEQKRIYALFKELSEQGGAREIEVSATINGVQKDLEVYVKAFKSLYGKTERLIGTTKDITAIKALYNQLLQYKEDLSEREHLLQHGTWELNLQTGEYSFSDGLFEVFGVQNQKTGLRMDDYILPGELEKAEAAKREVLEKGSAYIDDLMIRTESGELRYVEIFSKLILNSKGEPERIVGISRDVSRLQSFKRELKEQLMRVDLMNHELTEAKNKLEIKLHELEKANMELQLYKQTMLDKDEFLNQGTWEWDLNTGKMDYSRGIYRLFGYHHKDEMAEWDVLGKDLSIHMDDEENKRSTEDWVKILDEADTYLREMEVTTRDGFRRRLETFGKVFRDENGKAYKVIGTTRDITKLKEYEQELEVKINELNRSNKDLEEFAYIASHDLHEPLRKLSTFGQRLSINADKELSEANKDYLNRMLKATDNMRNLIDNLLEFSRVTRGASTFVKTDLNQLIAEVLNEQELRIEETKADIHVDQMPELEIVPSQIKQVFNNLLNNSLKFVSAGKKPVISFRCSHLSPVERRHYKLKQNREYYRISVEDNGIGFDEAYAEKIFQIFQRLHGKSDFSGSGIGLAICRKIADNHKGLIFAESEPGKGSVFTIILPGKP